MHLESEGQSPQCTNQGGHLSYPCTGLPPGKADLGVPLRDMGTGSVLKCSLGVSCVPPGGDL